MLDLWKRISRRLYEESGKAYYRTAPRKRGVYVTSRRDPTFGRKAWSFRYDSIDHAMGRPIYPHMTVAPPWAQKLSKKNRHI